MKKTISALALLTSTSAFALAPPPKDKPEVHNYCLKTHNGKDGSKFAGCDATDTNKEEGKKILENGCAKGQVALQIVGEAASIEACWPAGVVQL